MASVDSYEQTSPGDLLTHLAAIEQHYATTVAATKGLLEGLAAQHAHVLAALGRQVVSGRVDDPAVSAQIAEHQPLELAELSALPHTAPIEQDVVAMTVIR